MAAKIRPAALPDDEAGIRAIDTSFTTDAKFEIEAGSRSLRLIHTAIPPLIKRFVVYDLGWEWREWDEAHVAEEDGRIVGFAASSFQFWNRRVVLWHLYVHEPYRKRGIGVELLAKVLERAAREKALAIFIETSSLNVRGVIWYEKLGFTLCGVDTTLYSGEDDPAEKGLYFVKRLASG